MPRRPLPLAGQKEDSIPLYSGNFDEDLKTVSRNRLAEQIIGGLSFTQKMPCPSIGVSAYRCKIGSVLAEQENSTCSACYARKGRYVFDQVQKKLEQRYQGLFDPLWTRQWCF